MAVAPALGDDRHCISISWRFAIFFVSLFLIGKARFCDLAARAALARFLLTKYMNKTNFYQDVLQ